MQVNTFSIRDISKLCDVSEEAVRQWCRSGKLISIYDGYRYTIYKEDLLNHFACTPKHEEFLRNSNPKGVLYLRKLDLLNDLSKNRKRSWH